ncbi:Sec1-like protein [Suillus occidentalis]|nr:Sec1-like protein [Suillus occidentalis]
MILFYPSAPSAPFDSLIIADRTVDMITPLLTQLICEIVTGIDIFVAHVELPVSLLTLPAAPNPSSLNATPSGSAPITPLVNEKTKKHHLSTATDPLHAALHDWNFSSVGKRLSRVAHRLDEDYKARVQAKTVAQLRDFVGKLDELADTHAELAKQHALFEKLETDLLALNINGGSGPREEGDENGLIFALKACF